MTRCRDRASVKARISSASIAAHGIGQSHRPVRTRTAAASRRQRAPEPDAGAIHRDQGGQSGLPAVLPDGRLLRDVLRRRRDRVARARHRAHQARQASGPRYSDVRRAGGARRRISAPADRARPPRRGLRATRGPGRSEETRHQERGAARRGAAGDARHAHRRHPARCQAQQLSAQRRARAAVVGRRRCPLRARLDRYFDRRIPHRRMRPAVAAGRNRAAGAERDHRLRRALSPTPIWRPIGARCPR